MVCRPARGEVGSVDEPKQRAKTVCGRGSDEVKAEHAGFEVSRQGRRSAHASETCLNPVAKESQLLRVNTIAGGGDQMIRRDLADGAIAVARASTTCDWRI